MGGPGRTSGPGAERATVQGPDMPGRVGFRARSRSRGRYPGCHRRPDANRGSGWWVPSIEKQFDLIRFLALRSNRRRSVFERAPSVKEATDRPPSSSEKGSRAKAGIDFVGVIRMGDAQESSVADRGGKWPVVAHEPGSRVSGEPVAPEERRVGRGPARSGAHTPRGMTPGQVAKCGFCRRLGSQRFFRPARNRREARSGLDCCEWWRPELRPFSGIAPRVLGARARLCAAGLSRRLARPDAGRSTGGPVRELAMDPAETRDLVPGIFRERIADRSPG